MASVGEKLRAARLDQGLELAELSARTKISAKFLAALENDDRQSIPGGFFYRNWVQQYARALSLDSAPIIAEIDRIFINEQAPPLPGQTSGSLSEIKPAPINLEHRSGGGNRFTNSFVVLIAVVLGCSGLYAWWQHKTVQTHAAPPEVQKQPAVSVPVVRENQPVAKAVESPVAPTSQGDVQIEVSATEETWVSISGDGKQAFSGILQPAEIKTVAARDGARIRTGNAGGLLVRLNGKPIGPIGPAGQIRTVIINKTGFQILEAKPPAPASGVQS
jgi:cytoskeleton protein RodZ